MSFVDDDERDPLGELRGVAHEQVELLGGGDHDMAFAEQIKFMVHVLKAAEHRRDGEPELGQRARQGRFGFGGQGTGRDDVDGALVFGTADSVKDGPFGDVGLACRGRHRDEQVRPRRVQ